MLPGLFTSSTCIPKLVLNCSVHIAYVENENIMKEQNTVDGLPIEEAEAWEDVDMTTLREISTANDTYHTPGKLRGLESSLRKQVIQWSKVRQSR
jgi:hypothetical protein